MSMMKVILMVGLTLAMAVALTHHITKPVQVQGVKEQPLAVTPKMRASRFLAEDRNPRAADHCHKDGEVCAATNTTCCNNKCVELATDKHNCGACKNKCKFASSCCRGECVNLAYDKRHCGACGSKCMPGGYCIYGLCNYA